MVQIFSARTDRRLRRTIVLVLVLVACTGALGYYYFRSSTYWNVGTTAEQPIGFRHDLHVRELGLDCGFCHGGATRASAAGMPSAETCLTCHSVVWRGVRALQPLYTSVELGQPIVWESLYRLPEGVHFHHGAHAAAGVTCATCHGDVGSMQKTQKHAPMSMSWCLDCHRRVGEARQPEVHERVSTPQGIAFANPPLTDCSTCHY